MQHIKLGNIEIEVEQKDIKNIHLSVYPPNGKVRIAAPLKMDLDTIRVFAISKLQWIKSQQEIFHQQAREPEREYLERESHYFFGERYLLKIIEREAAPKVEIDHKYMHLYIRPNTDTTRRAEIMNEWYRQQLKQIVPNLITKWETEIGVKTSDYGIKKMRTKWGTCNTEAKRIWLNLELAKKPKDCLEYIIVHELVHLIEPSHNQHFVKLMDKFMPKWRFHRDELNKLPISHTDWKY
ncbi:MAG: M48 family metallopeptidase [Carboxylicivirga sp.]|jgi:predicted metal-dependent hydrolase|nr:M48 family metallopeptidase [Carboxylicivirga sp.]